MAKNTAKSRVKRTRPSSAKRATKRSGGRKAGVKAKKAPPRKGKGPSGSQKRSDDAPKGAEKNAEDGDDYPRKLGLRGAAPWAARHAAKHAAEARARNSQPAPPGSARATLRVPDGAEQIKATVAELHQALGRVRALCKKLAAGFYELGEILCAIRDERLYEAKGYGSFESFLDREIDLPKAAALRLVRVPEIFHQEAALEHGMDAVLAALDALDEARAGEAPRTRGRPPLPMKPPGTAQRG